MSLLQDLCTILAYIHRRDATGIIRNKLKDITFHGRELLGHAKTIYFKDVTSEYMNPETGEYSFLGVLGNDMIGWLRAEQVDDEREFKIRLWVSTEYPSWYPEYSTLS